MKTGRLLFYDMPAHDSEGINGKQCKNGKDRAEVKTADMCQSFASDYKSDS